MNLGQRHPCGSLLKWHWAAARQQRAALDPLEGGSHLTDLWHSDSLCENVGYRLQGLSLKAHMDAAAGTFVTGVPLPLAK
eukprot:4652186-Amphidinium_carterae.1